MLKFQHVQNFDMIETLYMVRSFKEFKTCTNHHRSIPTNAPTKPFKQSQVLHKQIVPKLEFHHLGKQGPPAPLFFFFFYIELIFAYFTIWVANSQELSCCNSLVNISNENI